MRGRRVAIVVVCAMALLSLGVAVTPAAAQEDSTTTVDSCGVLDQDGETYVLESNLTLSDVPRGEFACLTVDAENVVVDGQGHTLTYGGSLYYTGISLVWAEDGGRNSVEIRNVTLEEWQEAGIGLNGADAVVSNVTVRDVEGTGIEMLPSVLDAHYVVEDSVIDGVARDGDEDGHGIDADSGSDGASQSYTDVVIRNTGGNALVTGDDNADDATRINVSGNLASTTAYRVNVGEASSPPAPPAGTVDLGTSLAVEEYETGGYADSLRLYYDGSALGPDEIGTVWFHDNSSWERLDTGDLGSNDHGDFVEVEERLSDLPQGSVVGAFGAEPLEPTASYSHDPGSPLTGDAVTFDASASNSPNDEIVEYRWDFDGDDTFEETTTDPVATHTFDTAGDHDVTLQIEDGVGETNQTTETVSVSEPGEPTAAFTVDPAEPQPGADVTLDASGSNSPNGDVVEYRWDFDGDGTVEETTSTPVTTHTFDTAGEHTVTLEVEDETGATDETQKSLTVAENPAPNCEAVSYETDGDVYLVETVDQLQCIAAPEVGPGLAADYRLVADVDASGTDEWNGGDGFVPIGNGEEPFSGTFDGDGHVISDLTIVRDESPTGLFGVLTGTVERVGMENASVTGGFYTGSLVGLGNSAQVHESFATGTVSGPAGVGGLVGALRGGTVTRSYAEASVSGGAAGGLVGGIADGGTVTHSYAVGGVTRDGEIGEAVGGLVGVIDGGTVSNAYWDVPATGQPTSADDATGFGAPIDPSPIENMTGADARTNMTAFDFEGTWATVTDPDGYPILAWETTGEQTAALEIGNVAGELTNETQGHDYATVEIPIEETAGVETEGLTVTLTMTGDDEGVVFEETVEGSELQGEAQPVAFDVGAIDAADVYAATVTVEADNAPEGTATHVFEVQAETGGGGGGGSASPGSPAITIDDVSLSRNDVEPGESVTVTVDLSNDGDGAGTRAVDLLVDDETLDTTTVYLDAGGSDTVTFQYTGEDTGEYDVDVDGVDGGTVTVATAEQSTREPTPTETSSPTPTATQTATEVSGGAPTPEQDDGGGLGPLLGVGLALLVAVVLAAVLWGRIEQ